MSTKTAILQLTEEEAEACLSALQLQYARANVEARGLHDEIEGALDEGEEVELDADQLFLLRSALTDYLATEPADGSVAADALTSAEDTYVELTGAT